MNHQVQQNNLLEELYRLLMEQYGPQGWWPLLKRDGEGQDFVCGYHPGDYSPPRSRPAVFEVVVGALLTQNSSWNNAATALINLKRLNALSPSALLNLDQSLLKEAIRPARYFNQKSGYLCSAARWFDTLPTGTVPGREELLALRGVGPETADSILLYGFHRFSFVVDVYTRRIFERFGLAVSGASYESLRLLVEAALPGSVPRLKEFHALLVEHAKRYYSRRPYGVGDPALGAWQQAGLSPVPVP